MKNVCAPYFDPDFDNLTERIFGPTCRVCIDNESMEDCTVVMVDSVNKQGLLLEVVQVMTDLNLVISKSYISSDAKWFMDVFHVQDEQGKKLRDQNVINCIQQAIGSTRESTTPRSPKARAYTNNVSRPDHLSEHTAIEMSGTDRPGLFSEISAALADLHCNIVEAHSWSHNACLACVAYISDDQSSHAPIEDPRRLASIEDHFNHPTPCRHGAEHRYRTIPDQEPRSENRGGGLLGGEGTGTNVERRLHQLMLSVRDFDGPRTSSSSMNVNERSGTKMAVSIENCDQKGYSIVSVECKDRPRLMFDTEYFIRHDDGYPLSTESEKERVIKCLEAAIERRVCEGVWLKLCAENRVGLLSDITRALRENGLAVVRADIATKGKEAVNAFYVRDVSGNEVDMGFIKSMKKEMGLIDLEVKNGDTTTRTNISSHDQRRHRFSFGDLLKSQLERFSHNFIATKISFRYCKNYIYL
ncbi:ACT DOMAIN-CONTAINING PROTEIN ACR2 [Salix viminalis]|uniref:ACT domain-containing protein ACR n=1 Tax=Salix viminalis TaxID=40686 RepID=A0A9Q0ZR19_SALVM|nr:ACT DOMAIN-CONTAINING PROTEIN ACR2 [Salix viminalis]